jgi:hypothetical protein
MTPIPAAPEHALADLSESVQTKWRGYIDRWDPLTGIHGWALEADAPFSSITVELVVGDNSFHRIDTSEARADIDKILGVRAMPGFRFEPSIFARLAHLGPRRRDLPVNVRIADTDVLLRGSSRSPTVGELVDKWRQAILARLRDATPEISKGDLLLARLAVMRGEAESFRDLPLRPSTENEAGQIDAVHVASNGLVWFIGWMKRGAATEFPAIVVDRQKYPSAAAAFQHERQDLASRFVGVIGIMDTGWAPPAQVNEFFVYFGPDARAQLRAGAQTQMIGLDAFLAVYRQAQLTVQAGPAEALAAVLTSSNTWMPGNSAAAGVIAEASVDRLLMIPGFGCIVEGWAVSPTKRVQSFQMKLGDSVLVADESATYFRPRPDLTPVYGGGASIVARAGFVTVLRGALSRNVAGAPLLRVLYDDGTCSVHRVEPKLLHQLDCMADSADVLRLYPSLRYEAFYPALLAALRRGLAERVRGLRAFTVAPAQRVIVLRLPSEPNNVRLCFDCIARLGAALEPVVGFCLLADRAQGLVEAKLLFQELRSATSMPLSLFYVDDVNDGFCALPFILSQLLADRFVYVDRGVLLTAQGWEHAIKTLGRSGHSINFFEFVDDLGALDRVHGALSAACFGWTTAALLSWIEQAPPLVQGVFSTNGLPEPRGARHVLAGAAIRVEPLPSSKLADMIDEDLLSSSKHANVHAR